MKSIHSVIAATCLCLSSLASAATAVAPTAATPSASASAKTKPAAMKCHKDEHLDTITSVKPVKAGKWVIEVEFAESGDLMRLTKKDAGLKVGDKFCVRNDG